MEMTIEQKAKAYDEALEKARQLCAYPTSKPFISDLQDLFPELAESEDERIIKAIINVFATHKDYEVFFGAFVKEILSWLEKQGEHAKFRDSIQVGDKVTRNQDGMLVNLSQLNRVAKKDEKQSEQKPWSEEVDLELVTDWFDHIAQIADDRMTLTGRRMIDSHALDEIKCIAKNCSEFITKHYKAQKGE